MPVKSRKTYKSIFFDLDNTIWDFNKNSYQALKIAFTDYALEKSISDFDAFYLVYKDINEKMWNKYRVNEISKKELIRQRFQETFDHFKLNIDPIAFNDKYLSVMPEQNNLYEYTKETLEYLKKKNYTLYIITNGFKEVQHKKLENSGLATFFERIFVSEEVKCQKPGKQIFEHAIKSTNSRKKHSIMIGDSWEVDVVGAMNFGIDQVHFKPEGTNEFSEQEMDATMRSRTATYRINNMKQLTAIL